MVQSTKTFRVFVSSTFSDMKEERNRLQKDVFPKLRELCMQHGCRFQAIDLRWGVSEEAGLDQQTMKICLEEIERSQKVSPKPNFIVLLGDRYGWKPLPAEIEVKEFKRILREVVKDDEKELILWKEDQPDDKKGWYRLDENAVPPVYCLQPRTGKYIDYDKWTLVEQKLHSILLNAASNLNLEYNCFFKYYASATEQEIVKGALNVEDASDHVFCFFRNIENPPNNKDFIDLKKDGKIDVSAQEKLEILKERLFRHLPETNIKEYNAKWSDNGISRQHLNELCDDVYERLKNIILEQIKQAEYEDSLEKEIETHIDFGKDRAKNFVGRTEILQGIAQYIDETNNQPFTIYGQPGSGKSALMAQAAKNLIKNHPNCVIIQRFIGSTSSSSDITLLIGNLCKEIARNYGINENRIPSKYQKLIDEFPFFLGRASSEKPLIIFLDALDQLLDFENAYDLVWLPFKLPENVRIIVSSLPGRCLYELQRNLPSSNLLKLYEMNTSDAEIVLEAWLKDAGRNLQPYQKIEVLTKFNSSGLPLFLKLAFEETKHWKSYQPVFNLEDNIHEIINAMFERLSLESNHGTVIVSHFLEYIAASRYGLAEDEILDLLSENNELLSDFYRRSPQSPKIGKLPFIVWSRLYFDLEPYLTEIKVKDISLITFYHRQLLEVVKEKYFSFENENKIHIYLANYFKSIKNNDRKIEELLWQLDKSESWDELYDTFNDLNFFTEFLKADENKKYEMITYWNHLDNYNSNLISEFTNTIQNLNLNNVINYDISYWFALFMHEMNKYDDLEPISRKLFKFCSENYGPDDVDTIQSLRNLVHTIYHNKQNIEEAKQTCQRLVDVCEKKYGSEDPETARSLQIQAQVFKEEGNLRLALPLYRRSYEIIKKNYGPNDRETTNFCNNLALAFFDKGNIHEAEPLFRENLEIRKRIYGFEHPITLTALNNLALVTMVKGDLNSAEDMYQQLLDKTKEIFGVKNTSTANSYENLGTVYMYKGENDKAREALIKSFEIYSDILGPENYRAKPIRSKFGYLNIPGPIVSIILHHDLYYKNIKNSFYMIKNKKVSTFYICLILSVVAVIYFFGYKSALNFIIALYVFGFTFFFMYVRVIQYI